MDRFDFKILSALQNEGDLKIADLADRVGLSQTPCWRRLKALEADGVIIGRAVILDPAKLDLNVNVYAHIRLGRHDEETLENFEKSVCEYEEVIDCFSMSGEFDYIIRVTTKSIEEYESFLKRTLLHLPGVSSVNSSFALKALKMSTALPLRSVMQGI